MGAEEPPLSPVWCHCETSDRSHWLWQSVLLVQRATARVAPTEMLVGADDPVRPSPTTQHLVGQGPCALPGVR